MDNKNKKNRQYFPKNFKRKVLLEYAKGIKACDIMASFGHLSNDKKYASKLINKWKNEYYKNTNILSLKYCNIDPDYAICEINSIGADNEIDKIIE